MKKERKKKDLKKRQKQQKNKKGKDTKKQTKRSNDYDLKGEKKLQSQWREKAASSTPVPIAK